MMPQRYLQANKQAESQDIENENSARPSIENLSCLIDKTSFFEEIPCNTNIGDHDVQSLDNRQAYSLATTLGQTDLKQSQENHGLEAVFYAFWKYPIRDEYYEKIQATLVDNKIDLSFIDDAHRYNAFINGRRNNDFKSFWNLYHACKDFSSPHTLDSVNLDLLLERNLKVDSLSDKKRNRWSCI